MARIEERDNNQATRRLIWSIFEKQGRFKGICEMCEKPIARKAALIHHTRYNGATLKDLMIVCHKCNTQQENRFLE